jgi:hypothetical protein
MIPPPNKKFLCKIDISNTQWHVNSHSRLDTGTCHKGLPYNVNNYILNKP